MPALDVPDLINVCWLPAHPGEGSMSMQRYWWSLAASARRQAGLLSVECPLGRPVFPQPLRSRWHRRLHRHLLYPLRVRARVGPGLVHILDHSSAHLLRWLPGGCRTVVTVHDLIPLRDPGLLTASQLSRFRRCVTYLRRADRIVAVSRFTADDVTDFLEIPEERIQVIPQGVEPIDGPTTAIAADSLQARLTPLGDRVRVLSVGSVVPRKNLALLADVFAALRSRGRNPGLVRVGQPLPAALRRRLRHILGAHGLVELGLLERRQLDALYRSVDVLLVPSTLEGFGLPLLEAMEAGCPVVSSDAASLTEAGGDAALYFPPTDAKQAAEQILLVLDEPGLRERSIARGRERAVRYSWDRHLSGLIEVYRGLSPACR